MWRFIVIMLTVGGVSGCQLISDFPPFGFSDSCDGKACDPVAWALLTSNALGYDVYSAVENARNQGYEVSFFRLDFVSTESNGISNDYDWNNFIVNLSVNRGGDLRVASATRDGYLNISQFGMPSADFRAPLDAIGVRWSNAGDRLALVRRTADATLLTIYHGDDFVDGDVPLPLFEHAIDFPRPDEQSDYWRAVVSWKDDDSWILVSTDATYIDAPYLDIRNDVLRPVTFLIDPAAGELAAFPFTNAHFLQENQVVANGRFQGSATAPFDASQMLRVGRVSPAGLTIERFIDAQMAIDSDPLSGAMVTVEIWRQGPLAFKPPPLPECALRTLGSAPVVIGIGVSHFIYQLIPLEALTE